MGSGGEKDSTQTKLNEHCTAMRYYSKKHTAPTLHVFYTGIGSNGKHVYTACEFVTLMLNIHMQELVPAEFRVENPLQMNLKKWVKWAGADVEC